MHCSGVKSVNHGLSQRFSTVQLTWHMHSRSPGFCSAI